MTISTRSLATVVTLACALSSCKHAASRTKDSDAANAVKICKDKDAKGKLVGQMFGYVFMGAAAAIPGMTMVAGLGRGVLNAASTGSNKLLPSLVGTCDVTSQTLAQLKKDIDKRLGDMLDQLNALSLEVVHNNLAFYAVSLGTAVSDIEVYRAQILSNDDALDSYVTGLAASYGAMAVSISSIADEVKVNSAMTFMASAYDLGNAHAYFSMLDGDKLLAKILTSNARPSTKGQFLHNFDLMVEAYTRFLNNLADRKNASDMPYLRVVNVGGTVHAKWPERMLNHGKNVQVPVDCPYPVNQPAAVSTASIKFRDDHVSTFRYEYRTFDGMSGSGQITPELIEGFEVALLTRPKDKKARHGYTAVSGTYCDLQAYDDNGKLRDSVAAAIEEDPAVTKNPTLKSLNTTIDATRAMWDTIDANVMSTYARYLRASLAADPRWMYKFDESTGTGVPTVEAATPQASPATGPASGSRNL